MLVSGGSWRSKPRQRPSPVMIGLCFFKQMVTYCDISWSIMHADCMTIPRCLWFFWFWNQSLCLSHMISCISLPGSTLRQVPWLPMRCNAGASGELLETWKCGLCSNACGCSMLYVVINPIHSMYCNLGESLILNLRWHEMIVKICKNLKEKDIERPWKTIGRYGGAPKGDQMARYRQGCQQLP